MNELFFYGDYDLNIVSGGAALTERMLKEKPDLVRRFLRATVKALLWFRANEKESVARMAEGFKISRDDALGIYQCDTKELLHSTARYPASSRKRSSTFSANSLRWRKKSRPRKCL